VIYTPNGDGYLPDGKDEGVPQTLIGLAPAPEPDSFILLGSGLLGLAAIFYGRKRKGLKGV
jgi:LPXTG-motif cell wall-anchored protein